MEASLTPAPVPGGVVQATLFLKIALDIWEISELRRHQKIIEVRAGALPERTARGCRVPTRSCVEATAPNRMSTVCQPYVQVALKGALADAASETRAVGREAWSR